MGGFRHGVQIKPILSGQKKEDKASSGHWCYPWEGQGGRALLPAISSETGQVWALAFDHSPHPCELSCHITDKVSYTEMVVG